jgi:hypothetical protein
MNKQMMANTGSFTLIPSTASTGTVRLVVSATRHATMPAPASAPRAKNVENAVYAHIQAVRALGRTQIEPEEIARALGLSVSQVQGTIAALRSKGVKALHAS